MALLLLMLLLPQQKFYNYYESALSKLEKQDAAGAIQDLERAIALRPEPSANARTYGVQVKPYFPYSYLASAYWLAKDTARARRALNQAKDKGEENIGDENTKLRLSMIEAGLANMDSLYKPSSSGTDPVKSRPDLSAVTELALKGELISVLNYLSPLLPEYPDDTKLRDLYVLTQQQIAERRRAQEQEQKRVASIENQLREARRLENEGQLESALLRFSTVATVDPTNSESANAVRRLRAALAAKGRHEADIQKAMTDPDDEKIKLMQQELADSQARMEEMHKKYERQIGTLIKPFNVTWTFVPNARKALTATIQATVQSEAPLQRAALYVNSKRVTEWVLGGKNQFTSPKVVQTFTSHDNTILLQCWDTEGHVLADNYPYSFAQSPEIVTKKHIYILVIALSALVTLLFFTYQMRRRRAFRARFNPYVAGAPILNERMFYGRAGLLKQILNALHNNSLMVFGERRIGKTSFLHRLRDTLPTVDDPDYEFIPVFIDLQGVKEADFFSALNHEITQTLSDRGIPEAPSEAEFGVRQFTANLRKYIAALKEQCQKKPKLVLLLDEVDVMNSFTEQTNQQLRSVFMKGFAEHLAAVMAGIHINTKWKSEGSPWYNFFEQIELKPFPREQAVELITRPVQGIYAYTSDAIERILELTDGKPYLIQKLCLNLISYILLTNKRKIERADVDLVFKDIEREFTEPAI